MPRLHACAFLLLCTACSGPSSGGPCSSNRDCVSGETCVAGKCIPPDTEKHFECTTDDACPLDQYCELSEHVCKAVSISGMMGQNPSDDSGAASSEDSGVIPKDDDAAAPPEADSGVPAATDSGVPDEVDSGIPEVYDSGVPPDCRNDPALCTLGQVCDTNTGLCVAVPPPCANDSECAPPLTVCEMTQCVPGCGQPAGIQCTGQTTVCNSSTGRCEAPPPPPPPPPCALDTDCNDPLLICINTVCVPRCDAPNAACSGTDVCNAADGRCLPGQIGLGGNCSIDAQCTTDLCLGLSVGTTNYTVCSDPCSASGNCPLNFACTNVSGMNFCLGETLFGPPPAQFDTPSGGFCTQTTNTCQSGWCNTGTSSCIETCSRENDCASFGGNCYTYTYTSGTSTLFDHICYSSGTGSGTGATCTANTGCQSGVCDRYAGTCARHCCSDGDCGANQTCYVYDLDATTPVKVCGPRSATAGTGALGASCTAATDCESELCAPVNPDDVNSPRKCSTTCCVNSDCGALPLGGRCRPFGGPIMNTLVGACIPN